jgi:hypothetical protein
MDRPDKAVLLAKHDALLGRARGLGGADHTDRAVEATRIVNLLAEAFAWLNGSPTAAALVSADSLLTQAEERLRGLEDRPAARGAAARGSG